MRQLGDLIVWLAVFAALAGVIYLSPKAAEYVSEQIRAQELRTNPNVAFQLTSTED
jgi:hypothetical protein